MKPSKSFLRWVGGKRWLVDTYSELFPRSYNRYIEPFLGSGAVFFHLRPQNALLGDTNSELIETFRAIKSDWRKVWNTLRLHHLKHDSDYYYMIRGSNPRTPHTRAAKFIYLNRTCFNGIYRVNCQGVFNVPKGSKRNVVLPGDDFAAVASALRRCRLRCCDFSKLIGQARENDFVYIDPPYTVKHNNNNFVRYNEVLFQWKDQVRLSDVLYDASKRGAKIVISNANHRCLRNLYRNFGAFNTVFRNNNLASVNDCRGRTSELVITNIG